MSGRFGKLALDAKAPHTSRKGSFWSYQASEPTPSLEEAIRLGAIKRGTTQQEWDKLTPGMKRAIVREARKGAKDKRGFVTDPPVSQAQRRAMFAAKSGKSKLGIPQSVGAEFAEADPGGKLPERAKS